MEESENAEQPHQDDSLEEHVVQSLNELGGKKFRSASMDERVGRAFVARSLVKCACRNRPDAVPEVVSTLVCRKVAAATPDEWQSEDWQVAVSAELVAAERAYP